jgi:hypothetical protein
MSHDEESHYAAEEKPEWDLATKVYSQEDIEKTLLFLTSNSLPASHTDLKDWYYISKTAFILASEIKRSPSIKEICRKCKVDLHLLPLLDLFKKNSLSLLSRMEKAVDRDTLLYNYVVPTYMQVSKEVLKFDHAVTMVSMNSHLEDHIREFSTTMMDFFNALIMKGCSEDYQERIKTYYLTNDDAFACAYVYRFTHLCANPYKSTR